MNDDPDDPTNIAIIKVSYYNLLGVEISIEVLVTEGELDQLKRRARKLGEAKTREQQRKAEERASKVREEWWSSFDETFGGYPRTYTFNFNMPRDQFYPQPAPPRPSKPHEKMKRLRTIADCFDDEVKPHIVLQRALRKAHPDLGGSNELIREVYSLKKHLQL